MKAFHCYLIDKYIISSINISHDDVIKLKHFPRYWPFVRGIHRSPVHSPHKGQWRGTLILFFDLRPHKSLSKQSWGWWFETPSNPLWHHCNIVFETVKRKLCHVRDILDCGWLAATFNEESICFFIPSWRHDMYMFFALLAICEGNPTLTNGFLHEHPVMGIFDVFFVMRMSVLLKKSSSSGRFEMQRHPGEIIVM